MKKIMLFVILTSVLVLSIVAAANDVHRVYVKGNIASRAVAKGIFGVKHEFPDMFSTEVTSTQLSFLKNMLGVEIETVKVRKINVKPYCGDGKCHPSENPVDCPEDCSVTPPPEEPVCEPDFQKPWGIIRVNGGSGGAGSIVAVLDTGVDTNHPDLVDNIGPCVTKVTHMVPDMKSCEDNNGHGTHVAGTIAANAGSGSGIYGVAPEASLMIVKVCDKRGYCYGDDVAAGIKFAADNGANIISMSFGGDSPDYGEKVAIDYAVSQGVLLIAAAGNDGPAEGSIDYPGAFANVVAVGAIDVNENVASWSSRGIIVTDDDIIEERELELAAPGVSIESTSKDGCYKYLSGTSMATPHVSGLAAKLWQGAAQTRNHLQFIAEDVLPEGNDIATGFGVPTP